MRKYLVVAADSSRARFFCLVPAEVPEMESGPNLQEIEDLVNPELEEKGRDLWSENKSGRGMAPGSGAAHGYDDHRDRHIEELEQRFARRVASQVSRQAQQHRSEVVVIAAERRILGHLREALKANLPGGMDVVDTDLNISKLNIIELQEHLAKKGLIPARTPPQG